MMCYLASDGLTKRIVKYLLSSMHAVKDYKKPNPPNTLQGSAQGQGAKEEGRGDREAKGDRPLAGPAAAGGPHAPPRLAALLWAVLRACLPPGALALLPDVVAYAKARAVPAGMVALLLAYQLARLVGAVRARRSSGARVGGRLLAVGVTLAGAVATVIQGLPTAPRPPPQQPPQPLPLLSPGGAEARDAAPPAVDIAALVNEKSDVVWSVLKSFSLLAVIGKSGSMHRLLQQAVLARKRAVTWVKSCTRATLHEWC